MNCCCSFSNQEDRASYQIAAKEALRKLHLEKLEASSAASDEQRARVTAEQEAILVKEQLLQAQQEIEVCLNIKNL